MDKFMFVLLCSFIIFGATTFGALMVLFFKKMNNTIQNITLGLASGIMVAASIWSLLIPAIEDYNFIYTIIGFIIGVVIILLLDKLLESNTKFDRKSNMLFLAMTLHNIPEGMTVGLMATYAINGNISIPTVLALTIGIAIQNIPEGASVSMTYLGRGYSHKKSIILGIISGVVEPLAAIIMFFMYKYLLFTLPIILSLSAAVMIYIVINDIIHDLDKRKIASVSFMTGFLIMLCLDVLL